MIRAGGQFAVSNVGQHGLQLLCFRPGKPRIVSAIVSKCKPQRAAHDRVALIRFAGVKEVRTDQMNGSAFEWLLHFVEYERSGAGKHEL